MTADPGKTASVFLVLAQYSHYSDVLRGKLIQGLSECFKVIVLTPVIDAALARRDNYFQNKNVEYIKIVLTYPKFWTFFDKYLRVPLIRELDHLTYMKYFYKRPHWWVRKILMRLRVLLPKRLVTTARLTRWEVRLAKPSREFLKLYGCHRPALLVTATPGFTPFEAEMIVFAKNLGIKTVAIDINYDNLTSTGKLMRKTDRIAVWNNRMAKEARELHGYRASDIAVVGPLRFDHYFTDEADPRFRSRSDFLHSKKLDPSRKTVVYTGPTPSNYPPRREFMLELLRLKGDKKLTGDPNILVRLHPNDSYLLYREFENVPGLHIERAGRQTRSDAAGGQKVEMSEIDFLNLTETMKYADVVINFASTIIIEACLFDIPVINIAFPAYRAIVYEYEYNKDLVDAGSVAMARSPGELAQKINLYLAEPHRDQAGRAKVMKDYIPFRDGRAHERTVDFLKSISL